jgi:hypothetical protein
LAPQPGDLPQSFRGTRILRRSGKGLSQDFLSDVAVPLRMQDGDRLFAYAWLDPSDPPSSVQLQFHANGSWDHRVRWGAVAHGAGLANGADYRAGEVPKSGAWIRLEVEIENVGLVPGDLVTGWALTKVGGTVYWDSAGIHTYGPPDDAHLYSLLAFRRFAKGNTTVPADLRKILELPDEQRTAEQESSLRDHFLQHVYIGARSTFLPLQTKLDEIAKKRTAVQAGIPTTLIMKEREVPKQAFVLKRGLYDQKGEKVTRKTPSVLPAMPDGATHDRLGLAKWLVAEDHPLTARVAVNRFWQQLFGVGIVKTSEDFGNQGERPSHPELLDYLAVKFIKSGWDVKQLMKDLVMSSTYQQDVAAEREQLRADPDNRLLGRGPRFRLDGETLRDQALMLGGILVDKVGGPSVKPPQPEGLWKAVGYSSSNTARFRADKESQKVHRRSLYTFWKRTSPPPQMTTFDAPSREECRVRRERTNTPLQALLLMNDPQYIEAARCFAGRIMVEGGDSDLDRIHWALERATCNVPAKEDVEEVLGLLKVEREVFHQDLDAAKRLVSIGVRKHDPAQDVAELAAWTMIANLILNLDAVLTKG